MHESVRKLVSSVIEASTNEIESSNSQVMRRAADKQSPVDRPRTQGLPELRAKEAER